jgi:hypothetical protein
MLLAGYESVGYGGFESRPGALLLRHDIDICLDFAVQQAEVNHSLGVTATFFMLVSCDQYNLASKAGRRALASIRNAGQWIGLHFDAAMFEDSLDPLETHIAEEADILAKLSSGRVEALSFHRPVSALQGLAGKLAGLPHAYEPRFFTDIEYCSDSKGQFQFGLPRERDAFKARAPFQLLTHPIWWMRDNPVPPIEALTAFRAQQAHALGTLLADNSAPFRAHWESEQLDAT